jgi:DNA-binding ferritin-like protein
MSWSIFLIGKQLHWTVVGPAARSVHRFVDDLVESARLGVFDCAF